ncbi:pentatricopeptide repeat-containing protein At5g48910-like [Selaginella moellendorffii]|uniref:pentatricopeptide repeat-containing protein At5g48910-like n=1 Tax=Selaginella moellendorffii TaxID=88036 RepID=UPI000D1CF247|nr:pentatricopeptide repeat-containing protein At5g48910-like [Selaginella moellendorffii]XP_024523590.1 pentatricopeptide repeat-containing protein At5g48910-like [Selaginella moellendorffii]|eukprot:XP_024519597.1 pentatricopeptide repeat-containing protein At5g48910-like [Selaginella moellendorffii]
MGLHARMDCQPDCSTYAAVRPVAIGLLDCYGKCGSMNRAEECFNNMPSPDIICWNSLLGGYSSLGDSTQVFSLVKKIQKAGLNIDAITFISIRTACSHAGLVEEGKHYFDSMTGLGIRKSVEHYNCIVDILGRANRLEEALVVVNSIPVGADAVTWRILLGSCRKWGNVEIGKVTFEALVQAVGTKEDASAYVLMSDLYGSMSSIDKFL